MIKTSTEGPTFAEKFYLEIKKSKIGLNRDLYIKKTKSPEFMKKMKNKIPCKITNGIGEYDVGIVVSDEFLISNKNQSSEVVQEDSTRVQMVTTYPNPDLLYLKRTIKLYNIKKIF